MTLFSQVCFIDHNQYYYYLAELCTEQSTVMQYCPAKESKIL